MAIPVGYILISMVCSKKSEFNSSLSVTRLPCSPQDRGRREKMEVRQSIFRPTWKPGREGALPIHSQLEAALLQEGRFSAVAFIKLRGNFSNEYITRRAEHWWYCWAGHWPISWPNYSVPTTGRRSTTEWVLSNHRNQGSRTGVCVVSWFLVAASKSSPLKMYHFNTCLCVHMVLCISRGPGTELMSQWKSQGCCTVWILWCWGY